MPIKWNPRLDLTAFHFWIEEETIQSKYAFQTIQIRSGDLYSDLARTQTIAKLNHLGIFEYPTISYSIDSLETSLNTIITLRPRERFELEFGLDLTQSNIQDQGIAFNSSINVLNIFRGAEILNLVCEELSVVQPMTSFLKSEET